MDIDPINSVWLGLRFNPNYPQSLALPHIYANVYIYTYIYKYTYIYIYMFMYIYIYIYILF